MSEPKIFLMADVVRVTRLKRRTIDNYIAAGTFPAPFKMGNKNAWFESAITSWVFEQSEKGQGDAQ